MMSNEPPSTGDDEAFPVLDAIVRDWMHRPCHSASLRSRIPIPSMLPPTNVMLSVNIIPQLALMATSWRRESPMVEVAQLVHLASSKNRSASKMSKHTRRRLGRNSPFAHFLDLRVQKKPAILGIQCDMTGPKMGKNLAKTLFSTSECENLSAHIRYSLNSMTMKGGYHITSNRLKILGSFRIVLVV